MVEVQRLAICDLYSYAESELPPGSASFGISYFEIYQDKLLDLLNNKKICTALEDKNHFIQVQGLTENGVSNPSEMIQAMEFANHERKTCATTSNDTSSRSHAICHINIYCKKQLIGKLTMVDLAGSERANDCQSNDKQRQMEGAEINKSLLALKECIRALNEKATYVPFRNSKLTMVLRDSFIGDNVKIVMIACVSPGNVAADHTLNTLKYADRLKEKCEARDISDLVPKEKVRVVSPPQMINTKDNKENTYEMMDECDDKVCVDEAKYGELFALHSRVVKEDAMLLQNESAMLTSLNSDNVMLDAYIREMRAVIKKKLEIYSMLNKKMDELGL